MRPLQHWPEMLPRSIILALTLIKTPGKANASAPYLVCGKWNFHPYPFSLVQQLRLSKINKYVHRKTNSGNEKKALCDPTQSALHMRQRFHSRQIPQHHRQQEQEHHEPQLGSSCDGKESAVFHLHRSNRALKERNNSPAVMTTRHVFRVRLRIQDILA